LPEQIRDPLGGPDRRGEPVGFGPARQQVGELNSLRAGQLGWATWPGTAVQPGSTSPLIPLGPLMHRLPTHAQLPGNGRQPLAAFEQRQSRQPTCLQHSCVSSQVSNIRENTPMSIYLYRDA
jgi:hypothetical protein